jgi:methylglyoxal/glyoxal reductase
MQIPSIELNNEVRMPALGFGTWKTADGNEVEQGIRWALEAGYRLIDTAKIYGNEKGVGQAIGESGVSREEVFLTTKLWNDDQGFDSALRAIDESLDKLASNYVDLYLVHWPFSGWPLKSSLPNKRKETWQAMEEILKAGKARAIGVSNYTIEHLEEMKEYASILPAVNQIEFHPFLYQKELLEYCKINNIVVEAYCPLIHGERISDQRISAVAEKYGKSNAQVLLRWSVQHGCIPLPKSTRRERIIENSQVFDFEIGAEDMNALDALSEEVRIAVDPHLF